MRPKVSIIIPTYNRARYLTEALESALQQTYSNLEVIVVNDGSTDETEAVLAPYMKHIRYIKRENGGCAATKNTGLEAATGEFITNLDDDDRILPEKIQRQVEMFMERPNLGLCGTGVNFIDADGKVTGHYIPPQISPRTQVIQLFRRCLLMQSSVMIHRKCHDHLGNYKRILAQDYEFWLRVSVHYEVGVLPELLTEYRNHGDQSTDLRNNLPRINASINQFTRDFIEQTQIERIVPGVRSYPEAHALCGVLLCEKKLFAEAQDQFSKTLPNPVGHFGLFLLRLHEKQFTEAKTHVEQVKASDSPFASKVEEALLLMERAQTITQKPKVYHNTSPEVVRLRNDLSHFHTSVIRQLLFLACGGNCE
ncbi:MAG: glycosyltransferase [Candidatus Poribacteria bacterium]|nr:glycosyltransferase [Candidatus Poribacteria bacterium]